MSACPLGRRAGEDIAAVLRQDPAARSVASVVLASPGLHALWAHRLAQRWWGRGWLLSARLVSHLARALTGVEIHPAARIGARVVIDHGMGVVIGETAEVGDDVLLYQGVTLGGTSKEHVKRHPTIGHRVVVGAGAVILGAVRIGDDARIGAGAVVVRDVPAGATVVGVAGRVLNRRTHVEHVVGISESNADHGVRVLEVLVDRVSELERIVGPEAPTPEHFYAGEGI